MDNEKTCALCFYCKCIGSSKAETKRTDTCNGVTAQPMTNETDKTSMYNVQEGCYVKRTVLCRQKPAGVGFNNGDYGVILSASGRQCNVDWTLEGRLELRIANDYHFCYHHWTTIYS